MSEKFYQSFGLCHEDEWLVYYWDSAGLRREIGLRIEEEGIFWKHGKRPPIWKLCELGIRGSEHFDPADVLEVFGR